MLYFSRLGQRFTQTWGRNLSLYISIKKSVNYGIKLQPKATLKIKLQKWALLFTSVCLKCYFFHWWFWILWNHKPTCRIWGLRFFAMYLRPLCVVAWAEAWLPRYSSFFIPWMSDFFHTVDKHSNHMYNETKTYVWFYISQAPTCISELIQAHVQLAHTLSQHGNLNRKTF